VSAELTADRIAALVEETESIMMSSTPAGVIAATRAMAERPDSSPMLPLLEIRTLILVGDGDKVTPLSDSERMHAAIRGSKLVTIRDAAHWSNMEKPDEVNRAIKLFVT
jgi:pimeloyl-ACP methyl ester carboxylesterase